ncbi:unnamed protein product [Clonostachys solani]|uniref:Zn(2)-C6 fungal-type domain-containing protein n=1 Tax=Clonostachys solani TaxID=160281 RepID=A0A9N9W517_9HYPO|nr:unnamed protein product [Clonostachys solani]
MSSAPQAEALVIRRRPHYKSRTGCQRCRARRVKCDEQHPSCVNCLKRGVKCDYIQQAADQQTHEHQELALEKPPHLDLEMFHHFCALTAYTLSTETPVCDMWRIHVPQLALGADYIMDGICAFAALHKAHQEPDRRESLLYHATRYHTSSLEKGLPLVSLITPENGSSMYIFSLLTLFFNLARPRRLDDGIMLGSGLLPGPVHLLRGTHLIRESHHALDRSPVALVFQSTERIFSYWKTHVPIQHPALSELHSRIVRLDDKDKEKQRILLGAIHTLSRSYTFRDDIYNIEDKTRGYYTWLYEVGEDFLNLLTEANDEAMCILVFFTPLVRDLEAKSWWVEGWAFRISEEVYALLSEDFRPWIAWPIKQIGWVPPMQTDE